MRRRNALLLCAALCLALPMALAEDTAVPEIYPFMEQAEMVQMLETGERLTDKLRALYDAYGSDLSEPNRFTAECWMDHLYSLAIYDEWEALEKDLAAVRSAEDLSAVLSTRYIGVNAAPEGRPQPADLLDGARPMLAAAGYQDWPLLTALHSKAYDETMPAALILAAPDGGPDESGYRSSATFAVFADGRVSQIYGDNAGYDTLAEATPAQAERAAARVKAFLREHVPFLSPDEAEVAVSTYTYGGARSGPALRVFATDPGHAGMGAPYGASFEVSAETDRILWMLTDTPRAFFSYYPDELDEEGNYLQGSEPRPIEWNDGWLPEA